MTTAYDFELNNIDGHPTALSGYRDKPLLIVNVASKCGLTPQYAGLEALYRKYRAQGFVVLGFPCNQFAGQEPGGAEEIKDFCSTNYDVSFPLFQKLDVNGAKRAPLYQWLTTQATQPAGAGDIQWNFEKFLIDRQGNIKARFAPQTAPDAPDLIATLESVL